MKTKSRGREAFTLVEILAVLMIIALLAALITPVTMRALAKARNAAIKAEIDMLHMAIMNYKNEYGSFPPGLDATLAAGGPAAKHLGRLFPRCQNAHTQFGSNPTPLTHETAIVSWLNGYTDNPTDPLGSIDPTLKRRKLYDFDQSRVTQPPNPPLQYHASRKPNSPYLYIPASEYLARQYLAATPGIFGAHLMPPRPMPNPPPANLNDLMTSTGGSTQYFNPDTFQIICAGNDEQFGTDDDLSNFWPGTRQEYLDSLK